MLAACDDFGGAGFSLRGASAPQILVAARRIAGQAPWPAAGSQPAIIFADHIEHIRCAVIPGFAERLRVTQGPYRISIQTAG